MRREYEKPQIWKRLDGVEPVRTLLTFDSLRASRQEPSAVQTAVGIPNEIIGDRKSPEPRSP